MLDRIGNGGRSIHSHSIKISSSCTSGEPVDGLLVLRNLIVQRFDLLLRLESVSVYLFIFCLEDSNFSIFLQASTSNLDPQVVLQLSTSRSCIRVSYSRQPLLL